MQEIEFESTNDDAVLSAPAHVDCAQDLEYHAGRFARLSDESGQVLPWAVLLMLIFLGMSAMVVDVGHGILVKKQLQASADAAALAAAATLPSANYVQVAQSYSSAAGGNNTYTELSIGTPTITPKCLSTVAVWGYPCNSTSPNAVSVTETATIPTFFAGVLGIHHLTVSATATASKGSKPKPYNVAIVLDTTPSMNTADNNCKNSKGQALTQLQCATEAFQQLLLGLDPTLDRISLMTFPNVTTTTVGNDFDCNSTNPTVGPYTFPSRTGSTFSTMPYSVTTTTGSGRHQTTTTTTVQETYQVTGWSTDYRTSSGSTTLNSNSDLANAVGGSNCQGIQTSYENTYYAAAIYAAQASLEAEQAANPGTQNAIIFLSDGNATAQEQYPTSSFSVGGQQYAAGAFYPGINDMVIGNESTTVADNTGNYPSWVGQCGQGVDAANYATSQGTTVYTIAYGSPTTSNSSNCGSDRSSLSTHQNISPCQAMQQMSSGWSSGDTSHFFSDYYAPGGDSGCQASGTSNTITSLNNIVNAILGSMTGARLIPNSTT